MCVEITQRFGDAAYHEWINTTAAGQRALTGMCQFWREYIAETSTVAHLPYSTVISYPPCTIREYYQAVTLPSRNPLTSSTVANFCRKYNTISSVSLALPISQIANDIKQQVKRMCRGLPVVIHPAVHKWFHESTLSLSDHGHIEWYGWDWICVTCRTIMTSKKRKCINCGKSDGVAVISSPWLNDNSVGVPISTCGNSYVDNAAHIGYSDKNELTHGRKRLLTKCIEGCYSFRLFGNLLSPEVNYWLPISRSASPLSPVPIRVPLSTPVADEKSEWYFVVAWQSIHESNKPILHVRVCSCSYDML